MSQTVQLVIVNTSIIVGAIIAYIYFINKDKLKRSGQAEFVRKRKLHNRYVFYNNNVFLRKRFRRIVMKYSSLSCYSFDKVKEESVLLFEKSIKSAIAMPILSLIFIQDVMLSLLVVFVAYIYYELTVDQQIDKLYKSIIVELSQCMHSIRERYMESGSIPTAVLYADKGKYLDKPFTQIYEILTNVNGEELLYEFCRLSPVRLLKTLATSCYIINESGDERQDGQGQSAFEVTLMSLRKEADVEINRLDKTRIAFKSLSKLALVGLVCTPVFDIYLLNQIPGTSTLIKGMYGLIEKTFLIGATILTYYIISIMNRPSVVNQVDKIEWIDNLSKHKAVKEIIKSVIPKKVKTRNKLESRIKNSISSKTLEYIYTSKVLISCIAFASTLIFLMCFVITAKSYLWNNHKSLSFIPDGTSMEESTYKQIVAVDMEYMTQPEKMSDEDAYKLVKGRIKGLKDLDCQNQVDRLSLKWDKYYSLGFKWYFILIAYGAALTAWFSPELSLSLRKKLVSFEANEDVLQLQTMMIVLANTKMDVWKALYWLEKQSNIHKAPLRFAYHEYNSNSELALERLESCVSSSEFKRLISGLKAAMFQLSLHEAFSDMIYDKDQSLQSRERLQDETLESKKQWAKLIAGVPIGVALLGGFMGPIIVLGFSQLMKTFAALG